MKMGQPPELAQGLKLFNQGDYYEAHEYFEDAWRKTGDPSREFYRALLQISGGFFRLTQGKPSAAYKFFTHALKWLEPFPDQHLGFNLPLLRSDLQKIVKAMEEGQTQVDNLLAMLHPLRAEEKERP